MKSGRTLQHSIVVALLFAMSWTFVAARPASAATIVVDGVTCTLADAITAANTDTTTGGCPAGSGADTLDLVADITLTSRLPAIVSEVTLLGNGHTVSRLPSAPAFRILEVGYPGLATIDGVTITGGEDYSGGGILAGWASLLFISNSIIEGNTAVTGGGVHCYDCEESISRSVVRNNTATDAGGGVAVYFDFPLEKDDASTRRDIAERSRIERRYSTEIRESTITGNSAQSGGGLSYQGSGFLVEASTVSNNEAASGGGIFNYLGVGSIESSTISGNFASEKGGGIYNESFALKPLEARSATRHGTVETLDSPNYGGTIDILNSTIVGNTGPMGAGLFNYHVGPPEPQFIGRVRPFNSILAANEDGEGCVNVNGAVVESQGYNIESATSCGFTAGGDQQNVTASQLNLAPLADNGGPTWTHALTPGSVAIDQGNCPTSTADQRGYPRPVDIPTVPNAADGCDVGAFEAETPLAVTVLAFEAVEQEAGFPLLPLIVTAFIATLLSASRARNLPPSPKRFVGVRRNSHSNRG